MGQKNSAQCKTQYLEVVHNHYIYRDSVNEHNYDCMQLIAIEEV